VFGRQLDLWGSRSLHTARLGGIKEALYSRAYKVGRHTGQISRAILESSGIDKKALHGAAVIRPADIRIEVNSQVFTFLVPDATDLAAWGSTPSPTSCERATQCGWRPYQDGAKLEKPSVTSPGMPHCSRVTTLWGRALP